MADVLAFTLNISCLIITFTKCTIQNLHESLRWLHLATASQISPCEITLLHILLWSNFERVQQLWMTVEIINQILQKVLNNLNFLALLNTLLCMCCSCRLDFHENLANTFNNIVWLAYKLSNWKVMSKAFRQLFIFSSCWDFFFQMADMKHTSRLVLATKLGQQKSMEGIHYSLFL